MGSRIHDRMNGTALLLRNSLRRQLCSLCRLMLMASIISGLVVIDVITSKSNLRSVEDFGVGSDVDLCHLDRILV